MNEQQHNDSATTTPLSTTRTSVNAVTFAAVNVLGYADGQDDDEV